MIEIMKQKHRKQYTCLFVWVHTECILYVSIHPRITLVHIGYIEIKEEKLQSNTRHLISAGHLSRHETAPQNE